MMRFLYSIKLLNLTAPFKNGNILQNVYTICIYTAE